jgi:quinol monooxygenase YgiN
VGEQTNRVKLVEILMLARPSSLARTFILAVCIWATCNPVSSKAMKKPLTRMAELEIDPTQLESYIGALKEEIAESIRLEAGVLTLYAVSVKGKSNQIRIFETYADQAAYEAHLQTYHFKKYKRETERMIKSLKLIETDPILLGGKTGQN